MNYFGLPELLFLRVGGIIIILPLWKVFSKAGYPGAPSLGMILPAVNIALLYFLGFSDWPVLKEFLTASWLHQKAMEQGTGAQTARASTVT